MMKIRCSRIEILYYNGLRIITYANRPGGTNMERSLSMELVRVTEAAALASARWMGRGMKNEADDAATTAMRNVFDTVPMKGTVVIGEGEMDEAPMLYIGEKLGTG